MKRKYALKKFVIQYDLKRLPTKYFQDHCTPVDHKHSVNEV